MSRALAGALAASALLYGVPVWAMPDGPTGLDVLPSLLELTVRPGTSSAQAVTLTNPGPTPLAVSARTSDWRMSEQGEVAFANPGTEPRSCAAWIHVEPPSVVVPAHGQATVAISITSPAEFQGTHWAAVLFALADVPGSVEGQPVLFSGRVGLTVYVTAEGTEREEIELVGSSARAVSPDAGAVLTAALENRGNSAVRMRVTWQVRSAEGGIVATQTERAVSLPGARRLVSTKLAEPLAPGKYRVTVMARWGEKRWQASDCDLVIASKGAPASS